MTTSAVPPAGAIQAAIFDLDGTLIDSLADIADAGNRMLARRGHAPLPVERYPSFVGEGARKLVEGLLADTGQPVTDEVIVAALREYRKEYEAGLIVQTRPYPQVLEVLASLHQHGVRLAVLSNKPDEWTRMIVSELLSEIPFVEVRGQRQGVPRKPDPTAARELAAALAVPVDHIAFVGDTLVDMHTARAANMHPVAVTWGFTDAQALAAAQPVHMVDSMSNLARWLMR
ncbi:MAG: HAD family hydrolase [Myxococcales bacterium]|nr:HAD family hydrolase [Myxococcales bacterium]MDD9965762.1 HAD family hydrolase [Myxococcales bacterium]